MANDEFYTSAFGDMPLDGSGNFDREKAVDFALRIMQEIDADFSTRPLISGYQAWCDGTGPAIDNPQVLLEAEELTSFGSGFGPGSLILRDAYIARFGHAFPTADLIARLAALGPILEVGAGLGMIAHLVNRAGGDVIATDADPEAMKEMGGDAWTEVLPLGGHEALRAHPGRTLLCSWPGSGPWLTEVVRDMQPGQKIVVIGEGPGGATGSSCFFETIGRELTFSPGILSGANVWQFPMMKDCAFGFFRTQS